jgi:hypothetical protein
MAGGGAKYRHGYDWRSGEAVARHWLGNGGWSDRLTSLDAAEHVPLV